MGAGGTKCPAGAQEQNQARKSTRGARGMQCSESRLVAGSQNQFGHTDVLIRDHDSQEVLGDLDNTYLPLETTCAILRAPNANSTKGILCNEGSCRTVSPPATGLHIDSFDNPALVALFYDPTVECDGQPSPKWNNVNGGLS
eukprot:COSAG06_NODE_4904_length_3870_cov_223.006364_2_plen_142_part_00